MWSFHFQSIAPVDDAPPKLTGTVQATACFEPVLMSPRNTFWRTEVYQFLSGVNSGGGYRAVEGPGALQTLLLLGADDQPRRRHLPRQKPQNGWSILELQIP